MNFKRRFIPDLALVLSRFKFYNLTPLVDCQSLDPSDSTGLTLRLTYKESKSVKMLIYYFLKRLD